MISVSFTEISSKKHLAKFKDRRHGDGENFMKSFYNLSLVFCLVANPSLGEEGSRMLKNVSTYKILRSTPVSIMSYGIERLDDSLRDSQDIYFKNFKQDNEFPLLQAFVTEVYEPIFSPVIMIRATLANFDGEINRSIFRAEELCQNMLESLAGTVNIYLDEDNNYFNSLWRSDVTGVEYKQIDHTDIQNMVFLKAKIKHSGSDEYISCSRFF